MSWEAAYEAAANKVRALAEHYGLKGIPDRVWEFLARMKTAETTDEIADIARRGEEKMFIHCLSQWSKGMARGPITEESLRAEASKADNTARLLEQRGLEEAAGRHRARAERLRAGEYVEIETKSDLRRRQLSLLNVTRPEREKA